MNVSAKDKATRKEQSIVIKASSGLSDEDIEKMVKDAELHAEEDKQFQELVNARNQAEALVHSARKSMDDLGDQVTAEERTPIEDACTEVEEALKEGSLEAINSSSEKLTELASSLAQKAYEAAQAEGAQEDGSTSSGEQETTDDNVVDADFEEVKDDKDTANEK